MLNYCCHKLFFHNYLDCHTGHNFEYFNKLTADIFYSKVGIKTGPQINSLYFPVYMIYLNLVFNYLNRRILISFRLSITKK